MFRVRVVISLVFRLIILFTSLLAIKAIAFDASDDVSGAKDWPFIERFPASKIVKYEQYQADSHQLALGRLIKVQGVLRPDYADVVAGKVTRVTYQIPKIRTSKEVYEHYVSQLASYESELLYECAERDCGSSNYWANRIFNIAELYGPDQYQYYYAAKLDIDGQALIATLYGIKRGNKRIYAHIDLIELSKLDLEKVNTNPDTIVQALRSSGSYLLPGLNFDGTKLLPNENKQLDTLAAALKRDVRLRIAVVGHASGPESVEILKNLSLLRAKQVLAQLEELGVEPERLTAYGVGPLAPPASIQNARDRIEIVVLQ